VNHVTVGHKEAIRREEKARSGSLVPDLELDDSRPDGVDGADYSLRISIQERRVIERSTGLGHGLRVRKSAGGWIT